MRPPPHAPSKMRPPDPPSFGFGRMRAAAREAASRLLQPPEAALLRWSRKGLPPETLHLRRLGLAAAELEEVLALGAKQLSEPYTRFTYRHLIDFYPDFCFGVFAGEDRTESAALPVVAADKNEIQFLRSPPLSSARIQFPRLVGAVVNSLLIVDTGGPGGETTEGYIGMIVLAPWLQNRGLGRFLGRVTLALFKYGADVTSVVLETEVSNSAALRLYDRLGFVRVQRLHTYYVSGQDAFCLRKNLSESSSSDEEDQREAEDPQYQHVAERSNSFFTNTADRCQRSDVCGAAEAKQMDAAYQRLPHPP